MMGWDIKKPNIIECSNIQNAVETTMILVQWIPIISKSPYIACLACIIKICLDKLISVI